MNHGGRRSGAGRPKGSGKFGVATKAIRVPASEVERVLKFVQTKSYRIPLYLCTIPAGFPSPAENDLEDTLDLNELLIKHPSATFLLKVSGSSMIGAGIHHNDILIVDRSLEAIHGRVVVASINGELTVKRLHKTGTKVELVAENEGYPSIEISEEADLRIWGVVTSVIHSVT